MIEAFVETIVQMNDDNGMGKDFLNRFIASLEQSGILLGILGGMAYLPQETVGRLITYLHPLGSDAVILQQYVVRMEVELGNRNEVEFVVDNSTEGAEESVKYSVAEGEDIIRVPEAQDGYAWSESETAYVAPVYTGISENKKYYLIKSKEN